ncbi:MFS transporter [Microbispora hainanensis]|uniref:MFS transporter n=1 Tax=Microbispora hainanensis TaxID=568844 RepID=UPI0033E2FB78
MSQSVSGAANQAAHQERSTFRTCFGVAEFRVLFGSQLLLVLGDTVKMLAFSVLVYARTGSPGLAALAYMIGFLPQVAGGMLLLSLADRWRPRALMVAGDLLRVATCLVLSAGDLPIGVMLALVFAAGVPTPLFSAARAAVLPDVLAGDAYVLGRAVFTTTLAGAQVAGLAVGGGLLAVTGAHHALLITAALSLGSAALTRWGLRDRPARSADPARAAGPADPTGPAHPAGPAGLAGPARAARPARPDRAGSTPHSGAVRTTLRVNRALLADRAIRGLLLAGWLPPMLSIGAEAVYVPYLTGEGTAWGAGVVLAAAAAGMGVGEFAVGRFAPPAARERLTVPLALLLGAPLLGFAARPGVAGAAALAALAAAGLAYNLGLQRRFLDAVPEKVRGQAFGLQTSGLMTAQALGAAAVGAVAELVPAHLAIALSGCGVIAVVLALRGDLRGDRRGDLGADGRGDLGGDGRGDLRGDGRADVGADLRGGPSGRISPPPGGAGARPSPAEPAG